MRPTPAYAMLESIASSQIPGQFERRALTGAVFLTRPLGG
jgi:hypothetical protein